MLTDPSIRVVPAGKCSSTIRKSRSDSGVLAGTVRQAVMAIRGLGPERDLAGQVLKEESRSQRRRNPCSATLPSSSGDAG